jgi:hypothetical protein
MRDEATCPVCRETVRASLEHDGIGRRWRLSHHGYTLKSGRVRLCMWGGEFLEPSDLEAKP